MLPCSHKPRAVRADFCICRWVWGFKDGLGQFPQYVVCFFFRERNQLLAVFTLWEEQCSFSSPVTERQYSSLGLPIILLFSWTELNLPAQSLPRTHWEDDCSPTKPRCQEHSCKSKGRANHSSEVEQGGELPADMCWTKKLIVVVM